MRHRSRLLTTLAVVVLLGSAGCDGGGSAPSVSSSREEGKVKGTVTINGKPAVDGEVTFDPSNIQRRDAPTAKAAIGKDGSYEVKTLVGENAVTVSGPAISKDPKLSMNKKFVDVKAGENPLNIEVP